MGFTDLPVFGALKQKMQWHQTRQSLLAQNVANAETPGYRGRDLKAFDLGEVKSHAGFAPMQMAATSFKHINVSSDSAGFAAQQLNNFEIAPSGNGITLEDEMMKVAGNQMDYQAATTLYTRSLGLIKTALGR